MGDVGEEAELGLIEFHVPLVFGLLDPDLVAVSQPLAYQPVEDRNQRRTEDDVQHAGPPGLPDGRQDADLHIARVIVPLARFVGCLEPEGVAARIEIRVVGETLLVIGILPLAVESVQPIGVAHLARSGVDHGREVDRQAVEPAVDIQFTGVFGRRVANFAMIRLRKLADGTVVQLDVGDHNLRKLIRCLNIIGMKINIPVMTTEIDGSIGCRANGTGSEQTIGESIALVIDPE